MNSENKNQGQIWLKICLKQFFSSFIHLFIIQRNLNLQNEKKLLISDDEKDGIKRYAMYQIRSCFNHVLFRQVCLKTDISGHLNSCHLVSSFATIEFNPYLQFTSNSSIILYLLIFFLSNLILTEVLSSQLNKTVLQCLSVYLVKEMMTGNFRLKLPIFFNYGKEYIERL